MCIPEWDWSFVCSVASAVAAVVSAIVAIVAVILSVRVAYKQGEAAKEQTRLTEEQKGIAERQAAFELEINQREEQDTQIGLMQRSAPSFKSTVRKGGSCRFALQLLLLTKRGLTVVNCIETSAV